MISAIARLPFAITGKKCLLDKDEHDESIEHCSPRESAVYSNGVILNVACPERSRRMKNLKQK
jgi:hypothetical protein